MSERDQLVKTKFSDISEPKVLPHNLEAERGLLGSILIDQEGISKIIDHISEEDFYKLSHQEIFKAMKELYGEVQAVDIITVSSKLAERQFLEKCGGISYLSDLVESLATSANLLDYAKIVYEKRILRDLIRGSYEVLNRAFYSGQSIEEILDEAEKIIFKISQRSSTKSFLELKSFMNVEFERLLGVYADKDDFYKGVVTGFPELDSLLGGLHKSDLIIIGARPSLGKTALALNIAKNVAVNKKKVVGIFSLEMSKEQLVDRLLAITGRINLWKLRTGGVKVDQATRKNLDQALNELYNAPIYIDDSPSLNIFQMRGMARRLKVEKGLDLLIIDYLQLMSPVTPRDNEVQQINEISRGLKGLARELDLPVIAISQLSRRTEYRSDSRPKLSDLRQSGSIEQDADVVVFIHRPDKKDDTTRQDIVEIVVAKHRNGPTGKRSLYFDPTTTAFESLVEDEEFEDSNN